jgi:4-carboxymuconolactone decarboxylase
MSSNEANSSRLRRLHREELDEDGAALWDATTAGRGSAALDPDGHLVGPFNTYLYTPAIGQHMLGLGGSLRDDSLLDRGLNELAICTVCAYWRTEFMFAVHVTMAERAGVDPAVLDALAADRQPTFDDERQAVVYDIASQVVRTSQVDDQLYARALQFLDEREVVELIFICGWYTLGAFAMNTFRVPAPAGDAARWAH